MESTHATARCQTHDQPIVLFCLSERCNWQFGYACREEECQRRHDHPQREVITVDRLNDLIRDSYYSLNHLLPKIAAYFKQVRQSIAEQLHRDQDVLVYLIKRMEYCDSQAVWQTLNSFLKGEWYNLSPKRTREMTADLLAQPRRQSIKDKAAYYEREIEQCKNRLSALLKSQLYSQLTLYKRFANPRKHIELPSKIVEGKQMEELSMLLRKGGLPLVNATLAYRASENDFSCSSYHKAVDGVAPTITLVKTPSTVFGCYLNCKITATNDWIPDVSRKSFIFSLTRGSIHRLKDDDGKLKAAFGGSKGPQIGSGCDFYLGDSCDRSFSSGSRLGGSYEPPNGLAYRSAEADNYLGGSRQFLVEEYEVFKIN